MKKGRIAEDRVNTVGMVKGLYHVVLTVCFRNWKGIVVRIMILPYDYISLRVIVSVCHDWIAKMS